MGLDIHAIILQLIEVSLPHDKLDRDEHIQNLTPINNVSSGPSPPHDPEFSFYVGKETPKGAKFSFDDMMTVIISEELYPLYIELSQKEFTMRFNKTMYDHICSKLEESRSLNVPDDENIWMQPNIAFVNWFNEKGIDINSVEPFRIVENDNDADIEKKDVTDALWSIADDQRQRKDDDEFITYREAYHWATIHLTHRGNPITVHQLERAYHKAKSEGKVD